MNFPAGLPTDVATLQALLRVAEDALFERDARLVGRKGERIVRQGKLGANVKRATSLAKFEKAGPGQFQLALEDTETATATVHTEDKTIASPKSKPQARNAYQGAWPLSRTQKMRMIVLTLHSKPVPTAVAPVK